MTARPRGQGRFTGAPDRAAVAGDRSTHSAGLQERRLGARAARTGHRPAAAGRVLAAMVEMLDQHLDPALPRGRRARSAPAPTGLAGELHALVAEAASPTRDD